MAPELGFQNRVFFCSHDRTTSFGRDACPLLTADRPAGVLDPGLCRELVGRLHIIVGRAEVRDRLLTPLTGA